MLLWRVNLQNRGGEIKIFGWEANSGMIKWIEEEKILILIRFKQIKHAQPTQPCVYRADTETLTSIDILMFCNRL